jgi:hypothetical protein
MSRVVTSERSRLDDWTLYWETPLVLTASEGGILRQYDRTTLEMRGSSPQDRSGDSRQNENAQIHIQSI